MVRSWRAHADALTRDAKNCLAAAPSFAPLCRGQFSQFRPIARGAQRDRDVFRMWWMPLHDTVCVKRLGLEAIRAASGRADDSENALVEIGVYRHLADQPDCPVYLLRMLAVFQDCRDVWLVTEFGNGGDLFHTVKRRGVLAEGEARRYTWEVLQAISYLHAHDIAHRDVSAENVVLKDGSARLMDFGAVVPTTGACGEELRYFSIVGKRSYRAPECYVPRCELVDIVAPPDAEPGTIASVSCAEGFACDVLLPAGAEPGCRCVAQVYGYVAPPLDVFSAGVCLVIMLTGSPPWMTASRRDDIFAWVVDHDVVDLLARRGRPVASPDLSELLRGMLSLAPSARWTTASCLSGAWLAELAAEEVPVHARSESTG
mmetsp:Transcript_81314/g.235784  ORF Transcript_81314/g.235784 Transcript_81314/m.235784 type:complete len:373 (+) Transcript_81314:76-1194(+)